MNNPDSASEQRAATPEEVTSALFANLVMQHTNMAFIFLGRMPHPETNEVVQDFESAKFFIDQLGMLDVKTRGNLTKDEESLLKQSLMSLRMAYVDAATKAPGAAAEKPAPSAEPAKASDTKTEAPTAEATEAKPTDDESRKKFSKKY